MGPRPFSRGNVGRQRLLGQDQNASMGPRPFSRGNMVDLAWCDTRRPRFNGATTFQPWKPRLNHGVDFVGGPLQWGHDLSAVETQTRAYGRTPQDAGFNGATTFQPWKRGTGDVDTLLSQASMGPRPFSRGNPAVGGGMAGQSRNASMGPRPFSRGNSRPMRPSW